MKMNASKILSALKLQHRPTEKLACVRGSVLERRLEISMYYTTLPLCTGSNSTVIWD